MDMTPVKWAGTALILILVVVGLWLYARATRYQLSATDEAVWVMDSWSGELCGTAGGAMTCYREGPNWVRRNIAP